MSAEENSAWREVTERTPKTSPPHVRSPGMLLPLSSAQNTSTASHGWPGMVHFLKTPSQSPRIQPEISIPGLAPSLHQWKHSARVKIPPFSFPFWLSFFPSSFLDSCSHFKAQLKAYQSPSHEEPISSFSSLGQHSFPVPPWVHSQSLHHWLPLYVYLTPSLPDVLLKCRGSIFYLFKLFFKVPSIACDIWHTYVLGIQQIVVKWLIYLPKREVIFPNIISVHSGNFNHLCTHKQFPSDICLNCQIKKASCSNTLCYTEISINIHPL